MDVHIYRGSRGFVRTRSLGTIVHGIVLWRGVKAQAFILTPWEKTR